MAVKAINNTAGPNRLVPTLLVYRAYLKISNLDPLAPSITDQAAAIWKTMAEMVKLQVTERVKRTRDKENGTINLVNWGTCWNKTIGVLVVYLRSVRRPYGSFTARRKAVCIRVLLAPYLAASRLLRLAFG